MSNAKHTPGPWMVIADSDAGEHPNHAFRFVGTTDFDEDSGRGEILARMTDSPSIEANARLFAAAPDLLAACEAALAGWKRAADEGVLDSGGAGMPDAADRDWPRWMHQLDAQLRAAIAKARATV